MNKDTVRSHYNKLFNDYRGRTGKILDHNAVRKLVNMELADEDDSVLLIAKGLERLSHSDLRLLLTILPDENSERAGDEVSDVEKGASKEADESPLEAGEKSKAKRQIKARKKG